MRAQTTTALSLILANMFAGAALAHPGHARMPNGLRPLSSSAPDVAGETAYAKGKRLLAGGDFAGAMTTFRQALIEQPASADILNGLAVSYDRMGRPDLALPYYAAALSIEPASADLHNNLGYSLYLAGRYDEAKPELRIAAINGDPATAAVAQRTLAAIEAVGRVAVASASAPTAAAVPPAEPQPMIERTTEGEQRLVLDAPRTASASAADEDTALVAVARPWTARDDAALLAEGATAAPSPAYAGVTPDGAGRNVDRAIILAALAAFDAADPSSSARLFDLDLARLGDERDIDERPTSDVRHSSDSPPALVVARQLAWDLIRADEVLGPRRKDAEVVFDSDDAELNAFAARLNAKPSASGKKEWV